MSKKVYKTAKKFIKAVRGKKDFISAEQLAEKLGYKIVFYNSPFGDAEIIRYHLEQKAQNTKGFTYVAAAKIIFIDNSVHSDDKFYILLHEIGHIMLGHVGDGKTFLRNAVLMDIEADAFAHEVLYPTKHYKSLVSVLILCITLCTTYVISSHFGNTDTPDEKLSVNTTSEPSVYITRSGTRYHSENCSSTRNSLTAIISKTEAEKLFPPCRLCNPQ